LLLLEKMYPHLKIDRYVIMPNHIHAIFVLLKDAAGASPRPTDMEPIADDNGDDSCSIRPTIMDIVCTFKSLTARDCRINGYNERLFQTSFYDHIIRDREDYDLIARYIVENPTRWKFDKLYSAE